MVGALLVRWPDLDMPLERDEGEYAYAAQEIERGFMPYRDSFCQKPPVVFFWYLGGFWVFGESVIGIHLTMTVATAMGAFGLFLLGRRLAGAMVGGSAAAVYTISSAGAGYFGSAANTEIFMLVPVIAGVLWLVAAAERGGLCLWFGAGVMAALAMLTKPVALLSFIGPMLYVALEVYRRQGLVQLLRPTLALFLGGLTGAVPILGWLYVRGVWDVFWEAALIHNLAYIGFPFGWRKWGLLYNEALKRFVPSEIVLWLGLPLGVAWLAGMGSRAPSAVRLGLVWFVFSFLGVALGPEGYGHYFLQVLPPLALVAASAGQTIAARIGLLDRHRIWTGVLVTLVIVLPMLGPRLDAFAVPAEKRSFKLYSYYALSPFGVAPDVGKHLRQTTAAEDRLLIVGSEPEVLFYANRRSTTRYTIFYPLTGPYPSAERMIDEWWAETTAHPPARIILCSSPSTFSDDQQGGKRVAAIIAHVQQLLRQKYQEEIRFWTDQGGRNYFSLPAGGPEPNQWCLFRVFRRGSEPLSLSGS
jgi:4-amino-4-deoxy-L-arabinose transferase-like glycosyltransferase